MLPFLFTLSLCCLFNVLIRADGHYRERLDLTPLTPPSLLASFQFWGNSSLKSYGQQHFRYIPRSLGQILQHSRTEELHLRFSSGRWDDEGWGAKPHQGRKEGGTGVEIWAWVKAESEAESFARWTTLNNALSGLFCASMNFIDSTRTSRPQLTFQPEGNPKEESSSSLYLLHGMLPREVVCTENLTPFLKLLPCKGNAGIASLLDGHKLFDASWQSMAVDVKSVCSLEEDLCSIEMEQTVDMVLDIERSKRPRHDPIPRPAHKESLLCDETKPYGTDDACFPSEERRGQSWTLAEIFGQPMQGSCLAEDQSGKIHDSLYLHVPPERETIKPEHAVESKSESASVRTYTLNATEPFDMVLSHIGPQTFNSHDAPALFASRSITGHGQERGGIQTLLTNPSLTSPIDFVYFENLPWFMKPYLHTLRSRLATSSTSNPELIKDTIYRPALDRVRGTQLELAISIPANSTMILTYDFDKAILRYTEYPPDANRGFDVGPAVLKILPTTSGSEDWQPQQQPSYIRTTSLLLPLPTPDFSMPYNVIILTSTVMALAFGSIFNLLVRRFVGAEEVEGWDFSYARVRIGGWVLTLRDKYLGIGVGIGIEKEKKEQ